MSLKFGKNKSKKVKKKETTHVKEKEHIFSDVKLYRVMPIVFAVAVLMIISGFSWIGYNRHQYAIAQSKVSMKEGEELSLLYDTQANKDKGKLTLGRTILSKNHKQMAVSIRYDDAAHSNLSPFGKDYKVYFVCKPDYPAQNIHVKYGFFGTDGNGVLQITSDKPFTNEAFDIIIVDKADLATENDLTGDNDNSGAMDDDQLTKSITAQLANGNLSGQTSDVDSENASSEVKDSNLPAAYIVRLNPYSSKKVDLNWGKDEVKLVDNLFVQHNLNQIEKDMKVEKADIKKAQKTLANYNERLKINPDDKYAAEGKQDFESKIQGLQQALNKNQKAYDRLEKVRLSPNILGEESTETKVLRAENLNNLRGTGDK